MELVLFVYLAGIIDSLKSCLVGIAFACIGFTLLLSFVGMMMNINGNSPEILNAIKNNIKKLIFIPVFLFVFQSVLPSEKTMYIMAGTYVGVKMVQSDTFKQTSGDIFEIINLKISKIKNEMILESKGESKWVLI